MNIQYREATPSGRTIPITLTKAATPIEAIITSYISSEDKLVELVLAPDRKQKVKVNFFYICDPEIYPVGTKVIVDFDNSKPERKILRIYDSRNKVLVENCIGTKYPINSTVRFTEE